MSIEFKLLVLLLKTELTSESIATIENFDFSKVNWGRFIQLTNRNRLTNIVYEKLPYFEKHLPKEILDNFKLQVDISKKRMFFIVSNLLFLDKKLKDNIKLLWFKGAVLSQIMYKNPILRNTSDIDILVDYEDLFKLDAILRENGYEPNMDWIKFGKSHFEKYAHLIQEIGYKNKITKIHLDVHWRLSLSDKLTNKTFQELYDNAEEVYIQNYSVKTLNHFDNYHYLLIHGYLDRWKTLSQLFDVAWYRAQSPEFESSFKDFITKHTLSSKLFFGETLASDIFQDNTFEDEKISAFITRVDTEKYIEQAGKLDKFNRLKEMIILHPSLSYKLLCIENILFYGNNEDLIRLPKSLFFLYYIATPFRWLIRRLKHK